MTGKKEHPSILIVLGAALLTYATGRGDWILPAAIFIPLVIGTWISGPQWLDRKISIGGFVIFGLFASYLYQAQFLKEGISLLFLSSRILSTLSVFSALALVFIRFLPATREREFMLMVTSFMLVVISGNELDRPYYAVCSGIYMLVLLSYFLLGQKREAAVIDHGKSNFSTNLKEFLPVMFFLLTTTALILFMAIILGHAEKTIAFLTTEYVKLSEGRSQMYFDSSMKLRTISEFDSSDEPILSIEGDGPISDYLRCQVLWNYKKGAWVERKADAGSFENIDVIRKDEKEKWYVISENPGNDWSHRVTLAAGIGKILPVPYGISRVASPTPLLFDRTSALFSVKNGTSPYEYSFEGKPNNRIPLGEQSVKWALEINDEIKKLLYEKAKQLTGDAPTDSKKSLCNKKLFR